LKRFPVVIATVLVSCLLPFLSRCGDGTESTVDAGHAGEAGHAGQSGDAGEGGQVGDAGDAGHPSDAGDAGHPSDAGDAGPSGGTIVSTELIEYAGMTATEVDTFVALCAGQGLTELTLRLRAMDDWSYEAPDAAEVAKAKTLMTAAAASGMGVNLDLHTWYLTWDDSFRDAAPNHTANRASYLAYVGAAIDAFAGYDVKAWMVLNEPQAQTASTSENDFILSVISTAKAKTAQPVSVRFMGGYSPTTGHYSSAIDEACDFLARNVYWDPQQPSQGVYGTTEAKMDAVIAYAQDHGKELWISEFGKTKSSLDAQRDYVRGFVQYAAARDINRIFCWVSQPEGGAGEQYNIFDGYTPNPAFYELVSEP
jgi:hypothetical protein